jgi:hypothetical protein
MYHVTLQYDPAGRRVTAFSFHNWYDPGVVDQVGPSRVTGLGRHVAVAVLVRLADAGARVAFVLLALARTSSPAFGGELVAAVMVPHVVAAPAVGGLADRVRRLLRAADRRRADRAAA